MRAWILSIVVLSFVAKNMHTKVLSRLSGFKGYWSDKRLTKAIKDSFAELNAELLAQDIKPEDGCVACLGLLLGNRVIVPDVY